MAYIQAEIKRAFLRSIYRKIKDSAVFLEDGLSAFQDQGVDALKSGREINATSGGGHSVSFVLPTYGKQVTAEQVIALSEEFLTIYAEAVANLQAATPSFNPRADDDTSELAVFNMMIASDQLSTMRHRYSDFTLIGVPNSFGSSV